MQGLYRTLLTVLAAAIAVCAFAQPVVFVAQTKVPFESESPDPNLLIDVYLGNAFDELGQVTAVVWSMSDPNFRRLVTEGHVRNETQEITEQSALKMGRMIGADYILVIAVSKDGDVARPLARLYRATNLRIMWSYGLPEKQGGPMISVDAKDNEEESDKALKLFKGLREDGKMVAVQVGGRPDWESTALTLANTFAHLLKESVFKDLPSRPRIMTQGPGAALRINPERGGTQAPAGSNVIPLVDKAVAEGNMVQATLLLRDAIDQQPGNVELRRRLGKILADQELFIDAARVLYQAALLDPADPAEWTEIARLCVLGMDGTGALTAINNALARGAEGTQVYLIQGQALLLEDKSAEAVEAFTKSISSGPTPLALIGRGTAYALEGRPDKCKEDMTALLDARPEDVHAAYVMVVHLIDQVIDNQVQVISTVNNMPTSSNEAMVSEVQLRTVEARLKSLHTLLNNVPVPSHHNVSHRTRQMAYNLLLEAVQDSLDYVQSGRSAAESEANRALEVATQVVADARRAFRTETVSARLDDR